MADTYYNPQTKRIKLEPSVPDTRNITTKLNPNCAVGLFREVLCRQSSSSSAAYKFLLSGREHLELFYDELKKYHRITTVGNKVIIAWDDKAKFTFNIEDGFPQFFKFLRCAACNVRSIIVQNVVPLFHNLITEAIMSDPTNAKAQSIIWICKDVIPLESLMRTTKIMDDLYVSAETLAQCRLPLTGIVADTLYLSCTSFADFSHLLPQITYRIRKLQLNFNKFDWNDLQTFLITYSTTQNFPALPGITSVHISAYIDMIHPAIYALIENAGAMFPHIRRFALNFRLYSDKKIRAEDYETPDVVYQLKSLLNTMAEVVALPYELSIRIARIDQVILNPKGGCDIAAEFKRIRHELKNVLPFTPSDNALCFQQKYMMGSYKKLHYGLTIVSESADFPLNVIRR